MAKVTIAQPEPTTFEEVEVGQIFKCLSNNVAYLKIKEEFPYNAYNLQCKNVTSVWDAVQVQVCKNSEIIVA